MARRKWRSSISRAGGSTDPGGRTRSVWKARHALRVLCLGILVFLVVAPRAEAEPEPEPEPEPGLRVVVKEAPPFVWRDVDEKWAGLTLDLWRRITVEAELPPSTYEERTQQELLEDVEAGRADVGLGAISVTAARERRLDFSHPFFTTGLGVAEGAEGTQVSIWSHLKALLARGLGYLVGGLLLLLLVVGVLITWAERRSNPTFREVDRRRATGLGMWWAVVLALGNKSIFPRTTLGRVLALVMMVGSVLLLSVFVGAMASVMTVSQLEVGIQGPEDLRRYRVATVAGTTSEEFLTRSLVAHQAEETVGQALDLLAQSMVDLVVYDRPLLLHLAKSRRQAKIRVLPIVFEPQDYAIALSPDSELREVVNRALLEIRGTRWWREQRFLHLGE